MKVGLAQINPTVADFDGNYKKIVTFINAAEEKGCDLVVFPELAVCGYPARDLLENENFVKQNSKIIKKIVGLDKKMTIAIGYVERSQNFLYNAAAIIQNGKLLKSYRKRLLPFYDVFDEQRHFTRGQEPFIFNIKDQAIGVTICEDIWATPGFLPFEYDCDPVEDYKNKKLDLLINLSASPFHLEKPEQRLVLVKAIQKKLKCPVALCNQVGAQDEILFDGGSLLVTSKEELNAKFFEEDLLITEHNPWPKSPGEWFFKALKMGIQDYFEKTKITKAVVGISGGIDSAVCVAMAVEALGNKNVIGVSLPSPFTSKETRADAKKIAENLKIEFHEVPIDNFYWEIQKTLSKSAFETLSPLALENVQPRLRMTLLMAIANQRNALLLNTSNKSEIATGYSTLYGDTAGAIAVLGDLTKNNVYLLANYINKHSEIIPLSTLSREPSAELRPNQKDSDSLPPFKELDETVRLKLEKGVAGDEKFEKLFHISEFKRRQFPPILRVTSKAFGMGRRIPIVKAPV